MSRTRNLIVGWTLAVLAMVLFGSLSVWQSHRADEKRAMLDAASEVLTTRQAQPLLAAFDAGRARDYDWARGRGQFLAKPPLLLDNQLRDGRAGIRVYRLFRPDAGGELLVDLGWLPLAGNRALPAIPPPSDATIDLRGLLAPPPSSGLALGMSMAREGDVWLLTRIDPADIKSAVGDPMQALAPRVLRLDPALPLGYTRDLELLANTLPPAKHRAYSWQWFALLLAVLVTALVLTFRKPKA